MTLDPVEAGSDVTPRRARRRVACRTLGALALTALAAALPLRAAAQSLDLTGYVLGVTAQAGSSLLGSGGTSLLSRFRVMPVWRAGDVTVDVAYEHLLSRSPGGGGFVVTSPGGTSGGGDWMGLDWTIHSRDNTTWRDRFDRLSVGVDRGPVSVVVGRQAISWATTLFLTPADPFSPFDPSDPFREYRGGVDAVRVRAFTGPFSELEVVVRPADTPLGNTLTALARAQTSRGGWAFGGWAGALHDKGAAAVFASGAVGATGVRGEAALRRTPTDATTVRAAVGVDRRVTVAQRDLYAVLEVQYDGFGAADAAGLLAVAGSAPYQRGEMQTLGRWTAATQASWQAHPLVSLQLIALADLDDGSALLGPGASWSATSVLSVRSGIFFGAGREGSLDPTASLPLSLGSEYGNVPVVGYLAASAIF